MGIKLIDLAPAHKPILTKVKGRYHLSCLCSWQGSKFDSEEEALDAYRLHTGVIEKGKSGRR